MNKSILTQQKISLLEGIFNGPYQKQWPKKFLIEVKSQNKMSQLESSQSMLDTGIEINSGLFIQTIENRINVKATSHSKILKSSLLGWKTIWDGSLANLNSQFIELNFQNTELVEISTPDSAIRFTYVQEKPSLSSRITQSFIELKSTLKWGKQILKSGIVHVLLLTIALYSSKLNFVFDHFKSPEEIIKEKEIAKSIEMEVLMTQGVASEFNGKNISLDGIVDRVQVSEVKSQNIANKINKAIQKIGNISLNSLQFSAIQKSAHDTSAAADAIKNRLAQGQKVDLSAAFNSGLRGLSPKSFQIDTASAGSSITLKDQEEVALIFKSMQDQFRNCYESALLKDENLSVTVLFDSTVSTTGLLGTPNLSVSGSATSLGQSTLNRCLTQLIKTIKVNKKLSGVKIKNQFIFKL